MAEKSPNLQQNPPIWRLFCWCLSWTASNIFMIPWMFASFAAAGGYGIAITIAGFIASGTRVLDAVTDPVLALIIDKAKPKWGRHRTFGTIGLPLMIVGTMGAFSWGIPTKSLVVYIIFYCLYILGRTILNMSIEGGVNSMTSDPKQRQLTGRFASLTQIIPSTLMGSYMSIILVGKYGGMSLPMFAELGYTCCAVGILAWVLAAIGISPYDKSGLKKEATKTITFKDCINLVRGNKAFWAVIGAATSDKLAQQMAGDGMVVTMIFGIIVGNYALQGSLNLISLVPTLLIVLFSSKFRFKGKWAGNKQQLIIWCWISIVVAAINTAFVGLFNLRIGTTLALQILLLVGVCVYTGARTMTNVCNQILFFDLVDYEYYRSGNYLPATVGAVRTFLDKLISSLATTFTGFMVAAIGYTRVAPAIGDPLTGPVMAMGLFLWMGVPAIGFLISIISMKFYPIEGELAQNIREAAQKRRKAAITATAQTNAPQE